MPTAKNISLSRAQWRLGLDNKARSNDFEGVMGTAPTPPPPQVDPSPPPNAGQETTVVVTLHPQSSVTTGVSTAVSVGVPIPRGVVPNGNGIVLETTGGTEIPADISTPVLWQNNTSARSALIRFDYAFATLDPVDVHVVLNKAQSSPITRATTVESEWTTIPDPFEPSSIIEPRMPTTVEEPMVYATCPASYLANCEFRTQTLAIGANPTQTVMDNAYVNWSDSAVNRTSEDVLLGERNQYAVASEPWLFDRTSTLFGIYARTGDVFWLREAHRSANFYTSYIGGDEATDGFFTLKPKGAYGWDIKYSYNRPLMIDILCTGDTRHLTTINQIADEWISNFNHMYSPTAAVWTERHVAFKLMAMIGAWECTGSQTYKDEADSIIAEIIRMTDTPENGWPDIGAPVHSKLVHEGWGNEPVNSPWMLALLSEAFMIYWRHFGGTNVLDWIADLGDWYVNYGTFVSNAGLMTGLLMPWYLSSHEYTYTDDLWAAFMHAPEVLGAMYRALWAKQQLGDSTTALASATTEMVLSMEYCFNDQTRGDPASTGKQQYRLMTGRTYNYWFGSSFDTAWLESEIV